VINVGDDAEVADFVHQDNKKIPIIEKSDSLPLSVGTDGLGSGFGININFCETTCNECFAWKSKKPPLDGDGFFSDSPLSDFSLHFITTMLLTDTYPPVVKR
jgi:hypothetical protein